MPLSFALVLSSVAATIGVSAYVPPQCGYRLSPVNIDAWCNAAHWSVVAQHADGSEAILWQGNGLGVVSLPVGPGATYRLDVDY